LNGGGDGLDAREERCDPLLCVFRANAYDIRRSSLIANYPEAREDTVDLDLRARYVYDYRVVFAKLV
jgi:hypothetical protein